MIFYSVSLVNNFKMYRSSNNQSNRNYQLHSQGGHHNSKNYLNYINFQANPPSRNSQQQTNRQPEQIATYSINVSQHPQPRSGTPQSANSINRNAYLNPGNNPQQQDNKPLSRNSSNKEPFASRRSQQLPSHNSSGDVYNKTSTQGFHRGSREIDSSSKPNSYVSQVPSHLNSPSYSKTVDLHSHHSQQLQNSGYKPIQEDQLKQKLNYLQVLEHSLRQYEKTRSSNNLRQLNQDNRLLMLGVFEEINKLKDERSRKTISDNMSESDNYSESQQAYSSDDRSESRSNSIHSKRRHLEGLSKSRQKARTMEKDIEHERRLNQKLTIQYEEQLRKYNSNDQSELEKLNTAIQKQEEEIKRITNLNNQLASKLTHLPFHHEWKIMCGQAEGAKKAKIKIQDELQKRKQKLKQLIQESTGKKAPVKSEQTAVNQKQQKPFDGTASKKSTNLKIPPPPMTRPNLPQSGSIRGIKQTSLRQSSGDNRSKSNNRYTTS